MKKILLIILLILISAEDEYEELINEKVSEEYCNYVIGNITALIQEGYVYLDFLKAPKQPEGKENYFQKVDLISELNNIKRTNRTFFDFYVDIQNVINKARDMHFSITVNENEDLYNYYYCIPFYYYVKEVFDENNILNDTYLTIELDTENCPNGYSNETLNKLEELLDKKILEINGLDPYEYLDEMSKKGYVTHSLQSRYILINSYISYLYLDSFPFKKEDLTTTIKFEGEDEEFKIDYQFKKVSFLSGEFKVYYIKERKKYFKLNIPIPKFKEIELKFKIKKGLIKKDQLKAEQDIWELKSNYNEINCRVDEENKFNVFYKQVLIY